ncbi:MAG: threonine synthase [Lentisphaeria bacterium]|nr:threonine synthase [Lentisphaeria bacterium]
MLPSSSLYISTRGGIKPLGFAEAVLMGLAEDGGLLLPQAIPDCRQSLPAWSALSYSDLAFEIMSLYIGAAIPPQALKTLIQQSYAGFDSPEVVPLLKLDEGLFLAELFHGPTLAFKDVALQFLGNLFAWLLQEQGGRLNILGATSGDTGSAAICGVRGKKNINIFILYPEGRVSALQERQMATVPDANVHCLAIEGSFDDGQRIIKDIFAELDFKKEYSLAAVNSVNWARILAQIVYYFWACFRVQENYEQAQRFQVSVPTGNFGDIFAGYMAKRMGAPIERLILASNENDILSRFFNSGEYSRGPVSATLSPSMDIQVASNFERYLYYRCNENPEETARLMQQFAAGESLRLPDKDSDFAAGSGNSSDTLDCIRRHYQRSGYVLDPHSAVGVSVAERFLQKSHPSICLATAHPGKFPEAIRSALQDEKAGRHPDLEKLKDLPLRKTVIKADKEKIKDFIRNKLKQEQAQS